MNPGTPGVPKGPPDLTFRSWQIVTALQPRNPLEKVGGFAPRPFQIGFAVGGGRLDLTNRRFPGRPGLDLKMKSGGPLGLGHTMGTPGVPALLGPDQAWIGHASGPTGPKRDQPRPRRLSAGRNKEPLELPPMHSQVTLCYAIMLPGRKSAFQAGFWPECYRESIEIGPPASRRAAGGPISVLSR